MAATAEDIRRGRKFDQVLLGARKVFLRDGFDGASVDDIAREAGVSKATLYAYFPDKRLLFAEVARGECARQAEEGAAAIDMNRPARDVMMDAGRLIAKFMLSDFGMNAFRLCVAESDRFPDVGHGFYFSGPFAVREKIMHYLRFAVSKGELVIDDFPLAAEQFRELCKADLHDRAVFGVRPEGPRDVERTVRGAVDMFLARYGAGQ
jgi:TetR/AcrR family transcriptional regulator, mexJK operon transcriptional repressor